MDLPRSVQDIADVIGRERALYLIGQLPSFTVRDERRPAAVRTKIILYVPKTLKPTCDLVRIIGWNDASKLVSHFGGELLYPGTCAELHRRFMIETVIRLAGEGMSHKAIALNLDISERTVKRYCADMPPKDIRAANDNHRQRLITDMGQQLA